MGQVIQEQKDCYSAKEFLEALSPLSEFFKGKNETWLFRGQGIDAPLIPSIFRKERRIKEFTHRDINTYSELRKAERDVLIRFFQIADKRGLVLPDDSQKLRSFFERLKSDDHMVEAGYWNIEEEGLSIMALAQHYGIPTRLLDWSRQSYIAAFFSAEDAYRRGKEIASEEKMTVWSFYFPVFDKQMRYGDTSFFLRGITAPSATNTNLKAQQGVFTLLDYRYTEETKGGYIPMEIVLENQAQKIIVSRPESDSWLLDCRLRKFTLPSIMAKDVLYLLAKLDITHSAIYPGYQSIALDIQMQNTWVV